MNEYENEPVPGLPANLPAGEHVIWQGSPSWRSLAIRVFHVRKVAFYFTLLAITYFVVMINKGEPVKIALTSISMQLVLGAAAVGILLALACAYSRTTIYTVTNHRLVIRFGVAIQMMINIPWHKIDTAGLQTFADGTGEILLKPASTSNISYWMLWPHARPWRLANAQPLLRGLADADEAAASISGALLATTAELHVESDNNPADQTVRRPDDRTEDRGQAVRQPDMAHA